MKCALVVLALQGAVAFTPTRARSVVVAARRATEKEAKEEEEEEEKKLKFTLNDLRDLVSLGLGAPNLGTFKGVDKDTGTLNFELDKNRFYDKDGKEYNSFDNSKATYFESGEVDESADAMGQLMKFFGGGKKKDEAK